MLRKTGKFGYFITSAKNQSRRAYAIGVHTPDVTRYFISMLSRQLIECSVTLVTMVIFGTFYPAGPGTDPGLLAQVREGRTSTHIWKLLYHRSEPPTVPAPILGYSDSLNWLQMMVMTVIITTSVITYYVLDAMLSTLMRYLVESS